MLEIAWPTVPGIISKKAPLLSKLANWPFGPTRQQANTLKIININMLNHLVIGYNYYITQKFSAL